MSLLKDLMKNKEEVKETLDENMDKFATSILTEEVINKMKKLGREEYLVGCWLQKTPKLQSMDLPCMKY